MTLTVEDGAGYRVSGDAQSAEVVVEDNDEAEFALSLDPAELAEGESATIQVTVTNGVTFEDGQTIALDFAGSTATKGTDYTVPVRTVFGLRTRQVAVVVRVPVREVVLGLRGRQHGQRQDAESERHDASHRVSS